MMCPPPQRKGAMGEEISCFGLQKNVREEITVPEEVLSAIEFTLATEALFGQMTLTVGTFDALSVPSKIQHVEYEPIEYGPFASGTMYHRLHAFHHKSAAGRKWSTRAKHN